MDFTPNAIAALQHAAEVEGLSPRIRALVYDVTEGWPVAEHSIDFAIDTFCFKHIVGNDARDSYRDNLIRALAVRGWYLISFASIGDGYYGQYLPDASAPEGVIVDPANGIESVLYTRDRVVQYFHNAFDLVAERIKDGPDVQHGKMYNRQTYALLFRHRVNERP
ncbi:MAG: hypothetical protein EB121_04850 [Alphaproteobacteria bacterium]|nr:hypothetical protein [Alphaproteobacteria bacterium]